ncbi:hypothetical protein ACH5AU_07920 [Streptomyces albidoflavus]
MTKRKTAQIAALLTAVGLTYPIALELAAADLRPLVGAACTIGFFTTALTLLDRVAARLVSHRSPARRPS